MGVLQDAWRRAKQYDEIADVSSIARRYFAMNAFDGVVTIIGVLGGAMAAGITRPRIIVITGLTTALAMGVSGVTGAYLTETAERRRSLAELEKHTLTDLRQSRVGRASRFAVAVVTALDGLAPMLAAALVLIPFFAADALPSIAWCYRSSFALALAVLFALGAFLGRVSKGNVLVFGIKTTIAGAATIGLSMLLGLVE